jgi:hypothetical protein
MDKNSLKPMEGDNLFVGNGVPSIDLLRGMRDLGYTNIQANCDIIDNSIDAVAKDGTGVISIKTNFKNSEEKSWLAIIDNGCGMNLQILSKALIFGNDKEREDDELGKFGYGAKASALSMGRRLKIITKAENDDYYTGVFDYDEALQKKDWNFQVIVKSPVEDIAYFKENLHESTGTIVIVSKLDKLDDKNSTQLNNKLLKNIAETFRYFISTSKDDDKIKFYFNGKKITPSDPMCRDMANSPEFKVFNPDDGDYEVEINKKKYNFKVICYHVPFIAEDSPESQSNTRHTSYGNSGFYVLRNNRQIQRGSWLFTRKGEDGGMKTRHGTGNQFKAELFFNSDCDEIFRTDTKKMTINLPQQVVDIINVEVWSYLRGVQLMHTGKYKSKSDGEIQKDLTNIAHKMNNKVSTPTVLRNKVDKDIPSITPKIEPKNGEIKKKEHSRSRNKKVELLIGEFEGGAYAPVFKIEKSGVKKYALIFNNKHIFYERLSELDRNGKEFVMHLLHSMSLTLYSELYDVYLGETKVKLIEEFLEKFSTIFRKDSEV